MILLEGLGRVLQSAWLTVCYFSLTHCPIMRILEQPGCLGVGRGVSVFPISTSILDHSDTFSSLVA